MSGKKKDYSKFVLLIIDEICIVVSFLLATWTRYGFTNSEWFGTLYGLAFIVLILGYIFIYYIFGNFNKFFRRGFLDEFIFVFRNNILFASLITAILFVYQKGNLYSRGFFACFFFYNIVVNYIIRQYFKILLQFYYKKSNFTTKVIIITDREQALDLTNKLKDEKKAGYQISGVIILDSELQKGEINGFPVIANGDNMYDVIAKEAVDEILINVIERKLYQIDEMILEFENMGITVNYCITSFSRNIKEKMIDEFAGYHVLTFSTKLFNWDSMLIKRIIDIIGALVGIGLTFLLGIVLAPVIWIESPGPLVFSQTRIGKNGRRFKIYKFRSMYMDAEERKKELMEKNEMSGLMFKISDDPRITKVGKFIRKTSIDEFPQFFNVLRGEMSLVGTRPPTEDEFLQYEGRHKRRLALKPGITGLWQVSGRSDIQDFEEVVRIDLEYIDNWSVWLDVKVIMKTIIVVLFGKGAS